MNKVILLEGLDCASCASELEEILSAVKGVSDVSVDFIGQKVRLDCADENVLAEVIKRCNGFEDVKVVGTQQGRNSSENSAHESCCKEHTHREGSSCGCGHAHAHAACDNGHKHGSA